MSMTPDTSTAKPLTFRRFKDGDAKPLAWQKEIFDADHSHKCPTYIQSTPPCQGACPSGEDIRGYLNIVRGIEKPPAGMPWQEYAWRRLTEANPLPSVMGRVCPAPCESGCNRNQVEDFVGINSVEHFLGEWAIEHKLGFPKPSQQTGKTVAVIGAGPAGLSAAYQLARKGHAVTIFDERKEAGGMMRYGIPGFRTPREVLDAEIQRIVDLGVTLRMNCRIGTDITLDDIKTGFDAVFLGLGAQSGRALAVEGAEAPNVVTATAFLKAFNDGRMQHVGKRVVVIGGGDTSIDVATVARRLGHIDQVHESDRPENVIGGFAAHDAASLSARMGAEVTLTSIFAIDKMQASKNEVEHALAEGIAIRDGLAPVAVIRGADGRATALRVARCEAKIVGGKLDVKLIAGTEAGHRCRPDRLGDRPGGRFHRARSARQRQGRHRCRQELPGAGPARHVRRWRRRAPAPAHDRDRARRHRRRRHRPPAAQRGARQAAEDRRARIRPGTQDDREGLEDHPRSTSRCGAPTPARARSTTTTTAPTATSLRTPSCSSATSTASSATSARW